MNHWPFVYAAYALTAATVALLLGSSWLAMRRAERGPDA